MERLHAEQIREFVGAGDKRVESLGIQDLYDPMECDLIKLLLNTMHYRDERIHAAMTKGYAEILRRGLYDNLINQKARQFASGMFGDYGG